MLVLLVCSNSVILFVHEVDPYDVSEHRERQSASSSFSFWWSPFMPFGSDGFRRRLTDIFMLPYIRRMSPPWTSP